MDKNDKAAENFLGRLRSYTNAKHAPEGDGRLQCQPCENHLHHQHHQQQIAGSNDFLIIINVSVPSSISIIIIFQASSLNSSTVSVVSDDNGETELLPIRGTKVSRRKRQTRDVSRRKEYMLPCADNEKGNMLTICCLM